MSESLNSGADNMSDKKMRANSIKPLESMNRAVKTAYLEILANYMLTDGKVMNDREYAQIAVLAVQIGLNPSDWEYIRRYVFFKERHTTSEDLIRFLTEKVPEKYQPDLKQSLVKDLLVIYRLRGFDSLWQEDPYIGRVCRELGVTDEQVKVILLSIQADEDILKTRMSDTEISRTMKELALQAAAVGVPLTAVYFSGSVIGLSAAGITSGLTALGLGGFLGFSSMFTGIGLAAALGIGAYQGFKKLTGLDDDRSDQREYMLESSIEIYTEALIRLSGDIDAVTEKMDSALKTETAKSREIESLIEGYRTDHENGRSDSAVKEFDTLKLLMQKQNETREAVLSFSDHLRMLNRCIDLIREHIDFEKKELLIARLPWRIDLSQIQELTQSEDRNRFYGVIRKCYREELEKDNQEKQNDLFGGSLTLSSVPVQGESRTVYVLNDKLSLDRLRELYAAFVEINYFDPGTNLASKTASSAKNMIKMFQSFL